MKVDFLEASLNSLTIKGCSTVEAPLVGVKQDIITYLQTETNASSLDWIQQNVVF